jgi:hypothetical protein
VVMEWPPLFHCRRMIADLESEKSASRSSRQDSHSLRAGSQPHLRRDGGPTRLCAGAELLGVSKPGNRYLRKKLESRRTCSAAAPRSATPARLLGTGANRRSRSLTNRAASPGPFSNRCPHHPGYRVSAVKRKRIEKSLARPRQAMCCVVKVSCHASS